MEDIRETPTQGVPGVIRVALVSDNCMARAGMAQTIGKQRDMVVCGEFDTYRPFVGMMMHSPPEAAVLELSAGGGDTLDALTRCHSAAPKTALVVVSHSRDPEIAERAIKAGAKGYLYRNADAASLVTAIRETIAGDLHICRSIANPMLQKSLLGSGGHRTKHPELSTLSPREFQVFQLMGCGWDNQKIATDLGISIKTLNVHKEHLKEKLKHPSTQDLRASAAVWLSGNS